MQVEYEEPLIVAFIVFDCALGPLHHLFEQRVFTFILFDLIVLQAPNPLCIWEDGLNRVFLHIRDDQVKFRELRRERSKANWMEVNDFVSHILEDSVEGEVVMLP